MGQGPDELDIAENVYTFSGKTNKPIKPLAARDLDHAHGTRVAHAARRGISNMDFRWDEQKSRGNDVERGLPFSLAKILFEGPTLESPDDRHDYGELRIQAHGTIRGRVCVCVYTDRVMDGQAVRWIISLRKANSREIRKYHEWVKAEESG
jgi:uncharacterized DUF497 family protein